ncbi:RidA family protein [Pelagicoccus sp. SDUM812002]|nr:RidA family protein [Pelagicoccus sp. SDUM812002]
MKALGIELPPASKSVANYVPAVRSRNMIYLAGAIAKGPDNKFIKGKLGEDFTVDEGYQSARLVSIALLSALVAEIGDLDRVERIVRVEGFVNCTSDFEEQSLVINGCSDLLVEVFGEKGRHSRMAVGAQSLPFGAPVEIAAIVQLKE